MKNNCSVCGSPRVGRFCGKCGASYSEKQKGGKKAVKVLVTVTILVIVVWIITLGLENQDRTTNWSENNDPEKKTGSDKIAIGSGMPMTTDKKFEGPVGQWSPYYLVVKPNHYYTYEVDGEVDIQRRCDEESFIDGPGIQQPYRKASNGEEAMWRFRSRTDRKITATFHYSPK